MSAHPATMGVIAVSAPRVKRAIPKISRTAPTRNVNNVSGGIGEIVKHNTSTMAVMGSTEARPLWPFRIKWFSSVPNGSANSAAYPACRHLFIWSLDAPAMSLVRLINRKTYAAAFYINTILI